MKWYDYIWAGWPIVVLGALHKVEFGIGTVLFFGVNCFTLSVFRLEGARSRLVRYGRYVLSLLVSASFLYFSL